MKAAAATLATLLATPALAHPGHVAQAGGHSHWYLLGALAIAGVALWRGRRARRAAGTGRKA